MADRRIANTQLGSAKYTYSIDLKECFTRFSNTSKSVKNLAAPSFFNSLLGMLCSVLKSIIRYPPDGFDILLV